MFAFGDSFDCYTTPTTDLVTYWDTATATVAAFPAGRFSGSRGISFSASATPALVKASGVNGDALHHIVVAVYQGSAVTGSTLGFFVQLRDGATAQCSVVFRQDGAILLTSGVHTGTVLATYTGAVTATTTWYAFEIEVFISATAGYMNVRKNGNPANDFTSATNLVTRGGTANSYANTIAVGLGGNTSHVADDLYWRSDASSVPWMGDIRAYTRMPASDASVQFSRTPTGAAVTVVANTSASDPASTARYTTFVASYTGTVSTIVVNFNGAFTGNCKLAVFADASGQPAAVLASATPLVNPTTGPNTFTLVTPISVVKGVAYWFGISHDVSAVPTTTTLATTGRTSNTVPYASFPVASPTTASLQQQMGSSVNIGPSINAECVGEAQQDATTSYVYDSVVGHSDLYGIAPIASTPLTTYAVTTRAYAIKSDAGTRTMAVQLKSGSSTVASPTVVLTTSNWQWAWRHDTTDPATSGAWTAAAVNLIQVGPKCVA